MFEPLNTDSDPLEEGASMVEYALLVVLIAVVAIVAVNLIGPAVSNGFSSAGSGLAN